MYAGTLLFEGIGHRILSKIRYICILFVFVSIRLTISSEQRLIGDEYYYCLNSIIDLMKDSLILQIKISAQDLTVHFAKGETRKRENEGWC